MAEVEKTETGAEEEKEENAEEGEATDEAGGAEGDESAGEGDGEDGEGAPPKKGKKKLILIAMVVVIALGGTGAFFFLKSKKDAEEQAKLEAEAAPKKAEVIFHDLDEMIINLNTGGKNVSFMKLKVTVEVGDSASLAAVETMMPKIVDVFQLYLRELRPQDMQGSVGLYRLKEELLIRINKIVMPNRVNDLLFKEVLVQ